MTSPVSDAMERCAKLAEQIGQCANADGSDPQAERLAEDIAAEIRAMKAKEEAADQAQPLISDDGAGVIKGSGPSPADEIERLREALTDALAFMRGDISGPSQRDGIVRWRPLRESNPCFSRERAFRFGINGPSPSAPFVLAIISQWLSAPGGRIWRRAKMPKLKQSAWIFHDGSSESPVPETALVGDCDMGTQGIVRGEPIRAKSIFWKGVKRYKLAERQYAR